MGTLTFRVLLPDGRPAGSGAKVIVMDMWESQVINSGVTNSQSLVSITQTPGDYMVHCEKEGYERGYGTYYKFSETGLGVIDLRLRETPSKPSPKPVFKPKPKPTPTTPTPTPTPKPTPTPTLITTPKPMESQTTYAGTPSGGGGLSIQQLTGGVSAGAPASKATVHEAVSFLQKNALYVVVGLIILILIVYWVG